MLHCNPRAQQAEAVLSPGPQVLVQHPQILKTDSLVLTTLKPDGTQVLSTVQNPGGITTLTTPLQTTSLQVWREKRTLFTHFP